MKAKPVAHSYFALLCGVFVFLWTAGLHQRFFDNPTAVSRQNFIHSLAVHGQWHIDDYHENTPDKSFYDGHYYSDKAPATSFLMLPVYWASAKALALLGYDLEAKATWLLLSWICAISVLASLMGFATWSCVHCLSREYGQSTAWMATAGLLLGGMPLVYSTLLFSHALVVAALLLAACQFHLFSHASQPGRWNLWMGGFWLGIALASEYTCGLVVVGMGLWVLAKHHLKVLPWLTGGVLLPLLTIPFYNWKTMDSPFRLPYTFQASFPGMQEGLYGIKLPTLKLAWILLFSPERGLFFWSPVLLAALVGLGYLTRRSLRLFLLAYGCILLQVIVMSGRDFEYLAGVTFGPRFLAPILVFFLPGLCEAWRAHPRILCVLTFFSIALVGFAVLTHPVSYGERDPFREVMIKSILKQELCHTVWQRLGMNTVTALWFHFSLLLGGTGALFWLGLKGKYSAPAAQAVQEVPWDNQPGLPRLVPELEALK